MARAACKAVAFRRTPPGPEGATFVAGTEGVTEGEEGVTKGVDEGVEGAGLVVGVGREVTVVVALAWARKAATFPGPDVGFKGAKEGDAGAKEGDVGGRAGGGKVGFLGAI